MSYEKGLDWQAEAQEKKDMEDLLRTRGYTDEQIANGIEWNVSPQPPEVSAEVKVEQEPIEITGEHILLVTADFVKRGILTREQSDALQEALFTNTRETDEAQSSRQSNVVNSEAEAYLRRQIEAQPWNQPSKSRRLSRIAMNRSRRTL